MKKFNKKQIAILKDYWISAKKIRDRYWKEIGILEKGASEKVKVDVEFFHCDGCLAGIGDYERKYKLLHDVELE